MCRLSSLVVVFLLTASSLRGQEPVGAFVFAYRPHPGSRNAFERGYRAHLDWHRARGDSLTWYGWDVLAGPGIGTFVDGVFGIPFAALDLRVDAAGDATDLATNVTPHAEPVHRELLRLRPDLSSATPLERGSPARLAQVIRFSGAAHEPMRLEAALRSLRDRREDLLPYTVYESVAGSPAGFVLIVWRDRLGSFDGAAADPARALGVAGTTSEVWVYRPDMTYLPKGEAR